MTSVEKLMQKLDDCLDEAINLKLPLTVHLLKIILLDLVETEPEAPKTTKTSRPLN